MRILCPGFVKPGAVGHAAWLGGLAVWQIAKTNLGGLIDVVNYPLIVSLLLGLDLQPHDVGGGGGMNLRVSGQIDFQHEKFGGELPEIMERHAGGGIQGNDGPVARENRQRFRFYSDGAWTGRRIA